MHVHCPHCGARVPADDLNIETAIARCRPCEAVFSFAAALRQEAEARGGPTAPRRDVPTPRGVQIENWGGDLRIRRRWFHPGALFLVVFCLFWDGFLVLWYAIGITQSAPLVMLLFPLLHVAVGVGLSYFTLGLLVNHTVIDIGSGVLTLRHGPLPFPGNRTLAAADLDQLYCRQRIHHGRNSSSETYELYAIDRTGRKLKLLGNLPEAEDALFLEQQIEKTLKLKDRPVAGEYR